MTKKATCLLSVGGSVTVKSGATFYAGFASLTIAAINPDLSPSSDVINVNGTLHYGGTLVVYSIGHTNALMAGETFTVFPNGGLGSSDNVIFNSIETQPGTTLSFDGATGVVTVTATTAPSLNVAALGGGLMQINWDSSFYKLQWQTNALNTGLNLNWTDYPTTNKASVNVTNDLTIPATFFRLAPCLDSGVIDLERRASLLMQTGRGAHRLSSPTLKFRGSNIAAFLKAPISQRFGCFNRAACRAASIATAR